jgi:HK97 family phage prohead protease
MGEPKRENFTITRKGLIDKKKMSVEFIISDETIIDRHYYKLQLLHGEENVDLERKEILKLFYQHEDWNLPIGKWENVRVEDKKLKGTAIFDKNDEYAVKIFNKIKEGFIDTVSVGAIIRKYDIIEKEDGTTLLIANEWEVVEVSVANIPANPNSKIGLTHNNKNDKLGEKMTLEQLKEKHEDLYNQVYNLGLTAERTRLKEVLSIVKDKYKEQLQDKIFDESLSAKDIELEQFRLMFKDVEQFKQDFKQDSQKLNDKVKKIKATDTSTKEENDDKEFKLDVKAILGEI